MTDKAAAATSVVCDPDLLIPVEDETVAASVYRAADAKGPRPVVLMYVPYHKDDFITYGSHDPHIRYLAANGYDVVVADMVGTGASSGTKRELAETRTEGREAAAIVEWLAERPWTTGRVGMFGASYGGMTSLAAAAENPDPLDAIVSIFSPHTGWRDLTKDGSVGMYVNLGHWGPLMDLLQVKPPSYRDEDDRWFEVWRDRLDSLDDWTPFTIQLLEHESRDDYWAGKDIPVDRIRVPTFAVGGWRDTCDLVATTVEYFERIDAPGRLLLGPWRHTKPYHGREASVDFRRQTAEWFDHFLEEESTEALTGKPVRYWTERNGGGRIDDGVWRERETWPTTFDSDAETVTYALSPSGLCPVEAFDEGAVSRDYEYDYTVGIASTDHGVGGGVPPLTNEDDARSLCFETGPLDCPVELTGTGRARIRLAAATGDPILLVRLLDVDETGDARLVTHGHHRLSYRDGRTEPDPLVPGEEYAVELPLNPKSHVFEAGHRVRVAVSAAFFPTMLPPREHGTYTLRSDPDRPSSVSFPGRRLRDEPGTGRGHDAGAGRSRSDSLGVRHRQ